MEILVFSLLLLVSLFAISKGSDIFIDAAGGLGARLGWSHYLIGSLIVGIGTSLPEFVTSVSAVLAERPQLVAPNLFGTVIANILAGLGLSAVLILPRAARRLRAAEEPPHLDFRGANALDAAVPIAIFSMFLCLLLAADGVFSRVDAVILMVSYAIFMTSEMGKRSASVDTEEEVSTEKTSQEPRDLGRSLAALISDRGFRLTIASHVVIAVAFAGTAVLMERTVGGVDERVGAIVVVFAGLILLDGLFAVSLVRAGVSRFTDVRESSLAEANPGFLVGYLALGLAGVFIAGDFIIQSVVGLAAASGLGESALTASVVALGTSLPDILVAVKIARRGWHQMLIGHIIQSNLFDVLFITAICGLFVRLPVDSVTLHLTLPGAVVVHVMLLATLLDQRISAVEGRFLLVSYAAFLGVLFGVA